ncbi:MAG TPA: baseplate J/gp47 family protein [Candidatus Sulfotelmatobacter sp.]|nr:baseplate J/gp47 family protein [Candidatus Sulfotelmatobacter sp.]
MATTVKDRVDDLLKSSTLNGIDFVEIAGVNDQQTLYVHFLNNVMLSGTVSNPQITGGETIATVPVNQINDATDWSADAEGRPILRLTTVVVGDFSLYTLSLTSIKLDQFFSQSVFSFKANCPSNFDCEAPAAPCPPLTGNPPPIDYLAKDFLSFRQALMDFSALRYPEWQERAEADFGMMFLEALCGLADDLSYTQDRVAAEATLETATQRRSIVRQARLVDYEPRPATSATVQLQFNVTAGPIPAGLQATGVTPDGQQIVFEVGTGLADVTLYSASPHWNRPIVPYYWDDSQICLKAGTTEMWVVGQGFGFFDGQALLIDTQAQVPADPPIREVVHILTSDEQTDQLYNIKVTHITWDTSEALQHDHDLTRTAVAGNVVPATQGARFQESFAINTPPASDPFMPLAIVRTGPNSTPNSFAPMYLYTLGKTPLAWLAPDATTSPLPEIALVGQAPSDVPATWLWLISLLKATQSTNAFNAFTLDRAKYIPLGRNSDGSVSYGYDGDSGDTIRFGNDLFGNLPEPGTTFQVTYRTGNGAAGNLAADAITGFNPVTAPFVSSVTNPFAAAGGADEEPDATVVRLAPQAFRAVRYNAVLASDYAAAAETLPWVERAGTVFRWTGSWLTVFTTADPEGSEQITGTELLGLIQLLDRRRLAGYESYAAAPQYLALDLQVTVCAQAAAFRGDVEAAVLKALSAVKNPDGSTGFFYVDNFTFGQPLERSALEAAIQKAYGVAGVEKILYRQRGVIVNYIPMPDEVTIKTNQILRVDNDPSRPERGSLQVCVDGGK